MGKDQDVSYFIQKHNYSSENLHFLFCVLSLCFFASRQFKRDSPGFK